MEISSVLKKAKLIETKSNKSNSKGKDAKSEKSSKDKTNFKKITPIVKLQQQKEEKNETQKKQKIISKRKSTSKPKKVVEIEVNPKAKDIRDNNSQDKESHPHYKKIPKNINEYQHLLNAGNKEDSVRWMINLRQPNLEFKKPSSLREPSFYFKDYDAYTARLSNSRDLDIADPVRCNVGPLEHLFKHRPGEKATNSQLFFETSLRRLKLSKNGNPNNNNNSNNKNQSNKRNTHGSIYNDNPKRKLLHYSDFYSGTLHMKNKPGYFSTVFPSLLPTSSKIIAKLEPISKLYDVEINRIPYYNNLIYKKEYKVSNFGNTISGEHYSVFKDKCVDVNLGNRSQLFESKVTIGEKSKINWASSLRPVKVQKPFIF